MSIITLHNKYIYDGNLILVNREHGYTGIRTDSLAPVNYNPPYVLMQKRAAVLLQSLMEKVHGWNEIVPVSGWRSQKEQQEIWDNSIKENGMEFTKKYVAFPDHSEHQTGLAIDLGLNQDIIDFIRPNFPYTGMCRTFREKAAEYGFIERYPADKEEITGIGHEPWHFRYTGIPHAQIMAENNLTLEEYITFIKQFHHYRNPYIFKKDGHEISVSYLKAQPDGFTILETNMPYSVSGNNTDGFIITEWR